MEIIIGKFNEDGNIDSLLPELVKNEMNLDLIGNNNLLDGQLYLDEQYCKIDEKNLHNL